MIAFVDSPTELSKLDLNRCSGRILKNKLYRWRKITRVRQEQTTG